MPESFNFADWLKATGWDQPTAARELDVSRELVNKMAAGKLACSARTEIRCRDASRRLIERMTPFVLQ